MKASDLNIFQLIQAFAEAYPPTFQTLYEARPITCMATGTTFEAIPAPRAVIMDVR